MGILVDCLLNSSNKTLNASYILYNILVDDVHNTLL